MKPSNNILVEAHQFIDDKPKTRYTRLWDIFRGLSTDADGRQLLYLTDLYRNNLPLFTSRSAFEDWLLEKSRSSERDLVFEAIVLENDLAPVINNLLKAELRKVNDLLGQQTNTIATLKQEKDDAVQRNELMEAESHKAHDLVKQQEGTIASLKQEKDGAVKYNKSIEAELDTVRDLVKQQGGTIATLQQEKDEQVIRINGLERSLVKIAEKEKSLKKELSQAEATIQILISQLPAFLELIHHIKKLEEFCEEKMKDPFLNKPRSLSGRLKNALHSCCPTLFKPAKTRSCEIIK